MTYILQPRGERSRLRALDRVDAMDGPVDAFIDSLADAAAMIANAPIGAVTIVGHDQVRVKAGCGVPSLDTPRAHAFCSRAVMGSTPLIVPDLSLDPRFAENPFVTGAPHSRFYAGFPIVVHGGSIGAVCVVDDRPRTLTEDQIQSLDRLAQGAAAWFAIRGTTVEAAK